MSALADARWWWEHAACAGMWDLFEDPDYVAEAKAVCSRCPVLPECRADGDRTEAHLVRRDMAEMVLGGETRDERYRRRSGPRRRRRRAA